jgi:predicted transposase YbfD/YdcC
MSVLIVAESDINKLSSKHFLNLHKKSIDQQRYRTKTIYLFAKTDFSKKIYKEIQKQSKDEKMMSILYIGIDYEDAKRIYHDILISWFS